MIAICCYYVEEGWDLNLLSGQGPITSHTFSNHAEPFFLSLCSVIWVVMDDADYVESALSDYRATHQPAD